MTNEELLQKIKDAKENNSTSVDLSYEQLTELPKEIMQLTNLQYLFLNDNQLSELPQEITRLTNLQSLYLNGNQLSELPQEIAQLMNLQSLYIDESQLRNFAEVFVDLKTVEIYVLDEKVYNPIPVEVLAGFKTGQELLDYYFKPREIKLNEGKILLIGQGNVGKTSVRQRLMGVADKDYESKGRTEGVEIKKWAIDVKDEEIKINIWDFGGQEIYHTTHQFFFRSRCLYILVIDARAGERGSQLNYWLRQTHALGRNAPVIVVVNKAEKHDEFDKQQNEFDVRYDEIEKGVKALMEKKITNIAGCVSVSADMNLGFTALVELVRQTIEEKLPAVGTKITREEAAVKELLENETSDYVSGEEFQKLCRDVPEERRKDLIETLDALGVITCFSEVDMLKTIVLKPEWITKGIYKILSSYILGENNGRVNRKNILTIFQENEEDRKKYPPDKIDYILKIMGKRDLCFPETTDKGETELLFPVSFPVKPPNLAPFAENTTHFEYQYRNVYFDSIIVRFLRYAYQSLDVEPKKGNYWRRGVEFFTKNKKNRILVKADEVESKIIIKIGGDTASRRVFLNYITNKLDEIHGNFSGLEFDKNIFAPKRSGIKPFDYETLLKREEDGNEFITAYNADGEEIQVSIKYLLDGAGVCVNEKAPDPRQAEQLTQPALGDENLKKQIELLLERERLGSKKASLDAVSNTIWILLLAALIGFVIWRFPKVEDWSKPDLWTIIAGILAFIAVVPSLIKFIGNLIFHGNEEKKKKFSQYLYSLPLSLIKKIVYALGGFVESDYVKICQQINGNEEKGQELLLPSS